MLTKEDIKKGHDQNIMVFDSYNKEEEYCTARLAQLMVDVYIQQAYELGGERLDTLWIPFSVKVDGNGMKTLCGLHIERLRELDEYSDYLQYFKDIGGLLAGGDHYLVVGTGKNGEVLWGVVNNV